MSTQMEFEDGPEAPPGIGRSNRTQPRRRTPRVSSKVGKTTPSPVIVVRQPPPLTTKLRPVKIERPASQCGEKWMPRVKIETPENPEAHVKPMTAWAWLRGRVGAQLTLRNVLRYVFGLVLFAASDSLWQLSRNSSSLGLWAASLLLRQFRQTCPVLQHSHHLHRPLGHIQYADTLRTISLLARILWRLVQSMSSNVHLTLVVMMLILGTVSRGDVKGFMSWFGTLAFVFALSTAALAWIEPDTRCIVTGACVEDAVGVLPHPRMNISSCPPFAGVQQAWVGATESMPGLWAAFARVDKASVLPGALADETRRYLAQLADEPFVVTSHTPAAAAAAPHAPVAQEAPRGAQNVVSGLKAYLDILELQLKPPPEATAQTCPSSQAQLQLEIKRHLVAQINKWLMRAARQPSRHESAITAFSRALHETGVELLYTQTQLGHWELCFRHLMKAGREPQLVPWRWGSEESRAAQMAFSERVRPAESKRQAAMVKEECRRFRGREV